MGGCRPSSGFKAGLDPQSAPNLILAELDVGSGQLFLTFDQPLQGPGPLLNTGWSMSFSGVVRTIDSTFTLGGGGQLAAASTTGTFTPMAGDQVTYAGGNAQFVGLTGLPVPAVSAFPVVPVT